jgi:hypothetical protein
MDTGIIGFIENSACGNRELVAPAQRKDKKSVENISSDGFNLQKNIRILANCRASSGRGGGRVADR